MKYNKFETFKIGVKSEWNKVIKNVKNHVINARPKSYKMECVKLSGKIWVKFQKKGFTVDCSVWFL